MKNFLHKACLAMLLFVVGVCSCWAASPLTLQNFSFTSALDVTLETNDDNISLVAHKGSSGTNPGNYNNGIRLYQASSTSGTGGYITIAGAEGVKITSVAITTTGTYATSYKYSTDGGNLSNAVSIAKSETKTISNLNASYIDVYNVGTGSSGRLEIAKLVISYTTQGGETTEPDPDTEPTPDTFSFTVDIVGNGSVSFADGNGASVNAGDELESGTKITPTCTPEVGYEFIKWEYLASTSEWKPVNGNVFTITKNVDFRFTFTEKQSETDPVVPADGIVYKKVTSQSDIVDGGVYLIVCEAEKTAMGNQSSKSRRNNADVTISSNTIVVEKVNEDGYPYEVTLAAKDTYFAMVLSNSKYLGNGSKSENNLKEVQSYAAGYGWTLTYDKGNVTMKTNHAETQRYLCVNTANADSYATYTAFGSYGKVTLYKKEETTPASVTLTISSAGYATYYNEFAYVMPEGLQGKIMEYNKEGNIVSSVVFEEGNVVPAETALLLKGDEDVYPLLYATAEPDESIADYCKEYNLLHGSLIDALTEGGSKYYKFANDPDDGLGWYWGAANGAAFINPAHKAYLAIPEGANSPRFISIDNYVITAIEGVEANTNAEIYDLAGRRVKNATNGLYIVNGKKVIR